MRDFSILDEGEYLDESPEGINLEQMDEMGSEEMEESLDDMSIETAALDELLEDIDMEDADFQQLMELDEEEELDDTADAIEEIDYDAIYTEMAEDQYEFDDVNLNLESEEMEELLDDFGTVQWEGYDLQEQKDRMLDLSEYISDQIGFADPPRVEFYQSDKNGEYGYYSASTNSLVINESMLYDNKEAADTVAHELWHAYQRQCAENPQDAKDYQYQYGFENYIRPDDDFDGYQEQLVEAEARAFAAQIKERIS